MFAPPIWGDVLLRPSSPAPWLSGSGPSHPCAKCGADTAGIAIGGLCPSCTRLLERRAGKIARLVAMGDRKSTRLNSSHLGISYAVFCLKKKKKNKIIEY